MTTDVKQLAARLAREVGAIAYKGTRLAPPMYTVTDDQLETLVRRAIEEHEKASAEAQAVAWAVYDGPVLDFLHASKEAASDWLKYKPSRRLIPLYTNPSSIEDIRRVAEAAGYMLCRWEPTSTPIPKSQWSDGAGHVVGCGKSFDGEDDWLSMFDVDMDDYWLSGLTAPKEGG